MVERSSPTTSERTRVTTRAGAAARARPPPLRRERCLRTVLSSVMPAPARMSRAVTAALSSRLRPGSGAARAGAVPRARGARDRPRAGRRQARRPRPGAARSDWKGEGDAGPSAAGGNAWVSVALARVQLAQPGEDVELLQQGLGHGGEVVLAADAVEIRHQLRAGLLHRVLAVVAEDAVGLEVLDVAQELFTIEVGQCTALIGVQATSRRSLFIEGSRRPRRVSNLVQAPGRGLLLRDAM